MPAMVKTKLATKAVVLRLGCTSESLRGAFKNPDAQVTAHTN